MSSYQTITGRNGRLTTVVTPATTSTPNITSSVIARIKNWVLTVSAAGSAWGDSSSSGYTSRQQGRKDATFTCDGVYDTNTTFYSSFIPSTDNLNSIGATLWMDNSTSGSTDLYWDFPRVRCEEVSLTIDVDTEEVVGWSASFGADGIFYAPGDSPTAQTAL